MLDSLSFSLKRRDVEFYEWAELSHLSSMKIKAKARYIVYPKSLEELVLLVRLFEDGGYKYCVVGRMTNLLPSNRLYEGVIVKTDRLSRKCVAENLCEVECGAKLSTVLSFMSYKNFGGGEPLYHIPASVGGAIYSNAGAYGTEISDLLVRATVYNRITGECQCLEKGALKLGYRSSILKNEPLILLSATLSFVPMPREEIYERIKTLGVKRRLSQPLDKPSLGSVFKASGGIGAGYYIDKAGLKGVSIGGASVSEKHAGFIVNNGGATPEDVLRLIELIKSRVLKCFGVLLEEEIQII